MEADAEAGEEQHEGQPEQAVADTEPPAHPAGHPISGLEDRICIGHAVKPAKEPAGTAALSGNRIGHKAGNRIAQKAGNRIAQKAGNRKAGNRIGHKAGNRIAQKAGSSRSRCTKHTNSGMAATGAVSP